MTRVIAVSGKGGVGKTSLSALLLKYIVKHADGMDILVVDGDPAENIPEVLGLEMNKEYTISKITAKLKKRIDEGKIPPGYDKGLALESDIYNIMYEENDFDVLVLGRGEGEGCYCFINNLLKNIIDPLEDKYDLIFMDMEAGLEHLSRRTDKNVDEMIIVTDMSKMGFNTAERIIEVALEVHLDFKKFWVVGNRFSESTHHYLEDKVKEWREKYKVDIELAGFVPIDEELVQMNLDSIPLYSINDDNLAYKAVENIGEKIMKNNYS